MFANLFISNDIEQPDSKEPEYRVQTKTVFDLPVKGSLFSFKALISLGELKKKEKGHVLSIEMVNQDVDKISFTPFEHTLDLPDADNAGILVGLNNIEIPDFGLYKVILKIDDNAEAFTFIKFRELKNER
ncbi:MAG TPA: hypothetical protein K8V00_01665 [Ligilactobacillus acidipiscis]|uniref:Uncharacterized protein n=1 Tax=Ligilactobacillus acidipiscis TaxID=89059 RepID=A0A921F9D8_9LACO|nr:hypothetical protein [Ligilactobacillus acidipiscis]